MQHYLKTCGVFVILSFTISMNLFVLSFAALISPLVEFLSFLFRWDSLFPSYDTSTQNLRNIEFDALASLCNGKAYFEVLNGNISVTVPSSSNEKEDSFFVEATGNESHVITTTYHVVHIQPLLRISDDVKSVMFVHGVYSGPLFFRHNILPLINDGFDVFLLGLPGFGMSDVSPLFFHLSRSQTLSFYSAFLHQICSTIIHPLCRPPVIVAHSLGGFLCSYFCTKYLQDVTGLVLVNSSGLFPTLDWDGRYWAVLFKIGFPNRFARQVGRCLNVLLFHTVSSYETVTERKSLFWEIAEMNCSTNYGDIICSKFISFYFLTSYGNRIVLHDLICSPLKWGLIWGCNDNIIPAHAAKMVADLSQVYGKGKPPLYYIRGGWHNPNQFEKGVPFHSALRHFLHHEINRTTIPLIRDNISLDAMETLFKKYGNSSFDMSITKTNIETLYVKLLHLYSGFEHEHVEHFESLCAALQLDNRFYVSNANGIEESNCTNHFDLCKWILKT